MLSGLPENAFSLQETMARICHNHRVLTDPRHNAEGTQNTDGHISIKVKQSARFLSKMIAELERAPTTKLEKKMAQHKTPHNQWGQQQSFLHPHSISVICR